MRRAFSVVLCAALFGLAGCGGDDAAPFATTTEVATTAEATTTTAQATTTTTVAETTIAPVNTRYAGVFDLRDLVESTGYECVAWGVIADPIGATERATCTDEVVLSIYANASDAQASRDQMAEMVAVLGSRSVFLVGPNWTVNCGDNESLCSQLQLVLGGEISILEP